MSEFHSYQTLCLPPLKLWVSSIPIRLPITTSVVSEIHSYQTLCLSPLKLWVSSIRIRLCAYHHWSCEWVPFLPMLRSIWYKLMWSSFFSYLCGRWLSLGTIVSVTSITDQQYMTDMFVKSGVKQHRFRYCYMQI